MLILYRQKGGVVDLIVETIDALPELGLDIVRIRDRADLVIVCGGDRQCLNDTGDLPAAISH